MNGTVRIVITLVIIVLLSPLTSYARGQHGYYHGGPWIDPWWVLPFVPYMYYSAPPVIVQQPSTDYYIEPAPQQSEGPAYWYYCRKPEGYYPYVQQCPEGWMKVVPTAPSNR